MHGWGSWSRDPALTEGERPVGATPREALPNADYERQAASVGSAPEGAQIVQFGRLDRVT
jgi:hypothetical protein